MPANLVLVGKCPGCLSACSKKLHVLLACKLKLLYYCFSFKWKPFTLPGIWIFNVGKYPPLVHLPSVMLCVSARRAECRPSLKGGDAVGMKDFPLVLPLVSHGKFIFNREALIASSLASLGCVCCHMPSRAHAPMLQMLLLSSAKEG